MINYDYQADNALPGVQVQYVALRLEHALDDGSALLLADLPGKIWYDCALLFQSIHKSAIVFLVSSHTPPKGVLG